MSAAPSYRQVARLHAEGINQGFLSTLGERFLALLYEAMDRAPASVLLTHEEEGRVVGFVSGSHGLGAVYKALLRRPFRLAGALWPVLLSPAKLWRILEILRHSAGSEATRELPRAELVSIVVAPDWRGRQVAERLYRRLEAHFAAEGTPSFKIVVGEALAPAHRFYRRMGAVPAAEVTVHGGAKSVVYVHHIVTSPGGRPAEAGDNVGLNVRPPEGAPQRGDQ